MFFVKIINSTRLCFFSLLPPFNVHKILPSQLGTIPCFTLAEPLPGDAEELCTKTIMDVLFNFYFDRPSILCSASHLKVITALVAAGDRSWECVPTPCPGLEAAMLSVWQAAPDELPELVKRLDEEMKKVVQEVLRVLHRHFSSYPHLKDHLLNSIFGFTTSV